MRDRIERVNCALVSVSFGVRVRLRASREDVWLTQNPQENDGLVVLLVARTIKQRDLALTHLLP